jgi:hypothetical protein
MTKQKKNKKKETKHEDERSELINLNCINYVIYYIFEEETGTNIELYKYALITKKKTYYKI